MKNKTGFTLVEMLTVVMIVGILTAVVLPQYRRAVQKSQVTEAVAMLRVINDSGERLANEFGYKTFESFSGSNASKATFLRMDMFDDNTIACNVAATTLTCEQFTYYLNQGGSYVYARKNTSPYAGVEIRLSRTDIPTVTCAQGTMSSVSDAKDACDVYNITWTN